MLTFERLQAERGKKGTRAVIFRAKVPGGWLLWVKPTGEPESSIAFYPDPEHRWDGSSMT